jgi:hexulose-6-phosphate isomerase
MTAHPAPRRAFLRTSVAAAAGAAAWAWVDARGAEEAPPARGRRLKKAVKFGMIGAGQTIEEKFALIKSLGFDGVELDSPSGINREEAVRARDQTGIEIHGVVDSIHWQIRLSDPRPEVRAQGLEGLKTALRDAKFYGGSTVLLVPGSVTNAQNENFDQVWSRSTEEVHKAIPLAKELNVKIAIEVVWNNFLTTPEQLIKYVDQFADPIVGAYFDCSNMIKYGVPSAHWIRQLGSRMLKFDFKGYSKAKEWVAIGEGDEDWPEVLRALDEINYQGWATAEVGGGGREVLQDIAQRMNRVLQL